MKVMYLITALAVYPWCFIVHLSMCSEKARAAMNVVCLHLATCSLVPPCADVGRILAPNSVSKHSHQSPDNTHVIANSHIILSTWQHKNMSSLSWYLFHFKLEVVHLEIFRKYIDFCTYFTIFINTNSPVIGFYKPRIYCFDFFKDMLFPEFPVSML